MMIKRNKTLRTPQSGEELTFFLFPSNESFIAILREKYAIFEGKFRPESTGGRGHLRFLVVVLWE